MKQHETDIAILLAQIDWLEEASGTRLEGEDAALVAQIREAYSKDPYAGHTLAGEPFTPPPNREE